MDVHAALLGTEGAKGRENLVQQDNGARGHFGFRAGEWKIQRHGGKKGEPQLTLFNLTTDPAEKKDVSKEHPEVLKRLSDQLDQIIEAGRSRP